MSNFILVLPVLLFSVVAHEYAHAWTALRQGDQTAYMLGRLTLNPLPHLDPFMSVIFPTLLYVLTSLSGTPFTFGAAKPVPVNSRNFRHYRRGDLIVSSAGIVMNLILAGVCAVVFVALGVVAQRLSVLLDVFGILQRMLSIGVSLNVLLAFFNLIPIPPLDGSHLLYHFLPPAWGARYRELGRFGFMLLMATFLVPGLWSVLLWPVGVVTTTVYTAIDPFALPTIP
ncbi:MAG: site-2 protease family protein [Gemmatimonadetes bacterium]|nr:site-2 protease family protein [Gemmatimonadota bacterium]